MSEIIIFKVTCKLDYKKGSVELKLNKNDTIEADQDDKELLQVCDYLVKNGLAVETVRKAKPVKQSKDSKKSKDEQAGKD